MSTTNKSIPAHSPDDDSITSRIEAYLSQTIADGHEYLKSREIGEELDLTAKQVAVRLPKVNERQNGISIEKWGYSTATTWLVKPTNE